MSTKLSSILAAIFVLTLSSSSADSASNISRVGRRVNDTYVVPSQTEAETLHLEYLPRKWMTELFLEARNKFEMQGDVNPRCRRDYAVFQQFLQNQTVWAVRMWEASQWPSYGLLSGITYHLGNWDECLRATPTDFSAQYCLATVRYNYPYNPSIDEDDFEWNDWPSEQRSAWDVMQLWTQDDNRLSRQEVTWAMCIPASCRPTDLAIAVNETVSPVFKKYDMTINVHVLPEYCKTNEKVDKPISLYIVGSFLVLGMLNTLMLTIFESNIPEDAPLKGFKKLVVLYARFFSFRINFENLRKFSPENTYPIIHLFKILAAFFVISGHRLMLIYIYPTFNAEQHEMFRHEFTFELVETNVVDIFITISGFLMVHYSYESIRKGGAVYIVFYIIFRWLRMMSVPILLMIIILFIAEHLNNGPMWDRYFLMHVGFCKRNWWTTVLAVNNIIEPDQPCLPQTWYLSLDLQLTIMGAILLLIMSKNMKLGVIICFLLIGVSMFATAIVIFIERYWSILKFTITNAKDFVHVRDYYMFYVAPYNRIGCYIVGMLAALLSKKLKEKKYKFSPMASSLILSSTFIIGFAFTCYGLVFYKAHRPYDVTENAVYAVLSRILFSVPFACLFCIHFTSGLGVFDKILNNKVFVPYGRLVYCVYLVGSPFQAFLVISQRTYLPFQDKITGYWLSTADFVWAYFLSLVTHLTVEAPVNNILKFGQDQLLKKRV